MVDYSAKKVSIEALTDPKNYYNRVAILGASPLMKFMSEAIIKAARADQRVKNFSDREKAIDWLMKD